MQNDLWYSAGPRRAPAPPPEAAVRTRALGRRFGATVALAGIDLEVRRGEIYGFLGPNGAGKSTLVRVLCTLLRPDAGQALVAGHDVVRHPQRVRVRIGVALQDAALDDRQTGRELLVLQGRLYGLTPPEIRRRLDDVLDLVDVGSAIDRMVGTYSGGMKRRLDLAAALVHNPEILFLDEPTTGLDPDSRARVWSEVARLNAELGITVFLTTQYLEEADALADRVGIMAQGRLVAEGPPEALKRAVGADRIVAEVAGADDGALERLRHLAGVDGVHAQGGRVVVSAADGGAALVHVASELGRSGFDVRSITMRTPTLDDVFRELTGADLDAPAVPA
ncbi:MAG TPA: ATP-binding cassette domain-containing protein [Acidimicrobiales bacterium]|nr:ATP-binding cassette domain-containing protein [Acidimicrobiales bacterium]